MPLLLGRSMPGYEARRLARRKRDLYVGFARAGLVSARWGTSAAFFDYDADGDLDLFVCNYLDFDPERPLHCQMIEDRPFCAIERLACATWAAGCS